MSSRYLIQTRSGRAVDPFNLTVDDVVIEDIAFALSNIGRYNGHVEFYSVAQHCVNVSKIVATPQALLHDAWEAYAGDFARPVKLRLRVGDRTVHEHEAVQLRVIHDALGILPPDAAHAAAIKAADNVMLATEARDLMSPMHPIWDEWLKGVTPLDPAVFKVIPWNPDNARTTFLSRWRELRAR